MIYANVVIVIDVPSRFWLMQFNGSNLRSMRLWIVRSVQKNRRISNVSLFRAPRNVSYISYIKNKAMPDRRSIGFPFYRPLNALAATRVSPIGTIDLYDKLLMPIYDLALTLA